MPEDGSNQARFLIPRARIKLKGHALDQKYRYTLQADFGKGNLSLKDAYIEHRVTRGLRVRVGQWKRPFSRQQLASSTRLSLTERAITDEAFGGGRDIGVAIQNKLGAPGLEWALGVFNGSGIKSSLEGEVLVDPSTGEGEISKGKWSNVPDTLGPAVVARLAWTNTKFEAYSEGDLEGGGLRLGLGIGGVADLDSDAGQAAAYRGGIDYILKLAGFSTTGGAYARWDQDGESRNDQALTLRGFHAQASYAIAKRLLPAVRYALVSPEEGEGDTHELLGGLSVYIQGHKIKVQVDGGLIRHETEAGALDERVVRAHALLCF